MRLRFEVKHQLAPKHFSEAASRVYGTFGLNVEQGERVYVEPFSVDVEPGQIILFSGASGGGKTSCLKQFVEQTGAVWLNAVADENKTVIEHFSNVSNGARLLGKCGLSEAQLMLRYPQELSDGQRYRFAMARAIDTECNTLACDEFLATLDRVTAKVVACNIRSLVTERGLIMAVATTHEDLFDDLQPDWVVTFDGRYAQVTRHKPKKKESRFTRTCALHEVLARIGNGSKDGITEAQASGLL